MDIWLVKIPAPEITEVLTRPGFEAAVTTVN